VIQVVPLRTAAMPAPSRGLQLAGAAAALATLGLVTLVAHARQPAPAALLMRVPRAPQLWLGEHWCVRTFASQDSGLASVAAHHSVSDICKETGTWREVCRPASRGRIVVAAAAWVDPLSHRSACSPRYIDGLEDDGQYMVPSTPADETSGNALFDFGNGNGVPLAKSNGEPVPGHLPAQYWQKTGTSESHFPNEINQFDIEGIRELEDGHVPWWERDDYYDDTYPKYRMDMGFIEGPRVSIDNGHVEGMSTFLVLIATGCSFTE
jgi:hypothetical protein